MAIQTYGTVIESRNVKSTNDLLEIDIHTRRAERGIREYLDRRGLCKVPSLLLPHA